MRTLPAPLCRICAAAAETLAAALPDAVVQNPEAWEMQLTLAELDTDTHAVPQSAILSIYTNFRGIGKNKVMDMLAAAVGSRSRA